MEKLTFTVPQTDEEVTFYIVEETKINGYNYLLVTEEDDVEGESEAYILKDTSKAEDADAVYEFVEDDEELEIVSDVFAKMLDDITLE
ncbi:MAG: DUF1292 domain-containing protein [Lachnospiraceae bacterium]|nr:DUF1292 domain-containing protein [Lachnospiraceae bacterium]